MSDDQPETVVHGEAMLLSVICGEGEATWVCEMGQHACGVVIVANRKVKNVNAWLWPFVRSCGRRSSFAQKQGLAED